ncbi:flagellar motor switch protein FliM [Atopococcus tabaci]|uniref:flagellar motor switch protein FliM n=1 Tax=Atopococcus tabaci TaxID=269774 RepID=UPI000420712E|nr:flagellar motor switch protein FliM [Atopococcus tabaci]
MSQAVLSQQEIDSLLEAMDKGEFDEELLAETEQPKVKAYDFRRPVRLSKEYLSTITMVLEDFSKIAGNQLSTQLRKQVEMKMESIEQVSFDEFVHSVPRFTLMGTMSSQPHKGSQVIEINPQLSLQMVEVLCGYDDDAITPMESTKESFTDIELAILEEVIQTFVRAFESSWRGITELDTKLDSIDTNPQLLQTMSPNEAVVLTTFSITLGQNRTFMNVCIPYIFFEDILDKLSFRNWFHEGKGADESDHQKFAKNLERVPVSVEVELGTAYMSVENFLDMEVGDVIQLDNKTSAPLTMLVEDRPYYRVKPGIVDNQMAVEVLQFTGGEATDE